MIKFRNPDYNAIFLKDGFVTFPLLNSQQVNRLREFYLHNKTHHLTQQPVLHSTSDTGNYELIKKVDAFIQQELREAVNNVIEEYEPLIANFLTKEPGDKSETDFHQDPTLVDESKYVSGNIWVPLQDTDTINGNLRAIKGSHKATNNLRTTPDCPLFFQEFKKSLNKYATEIPLKAGHAVFISHSTVHGATANRTNEERIAVVLAIKSLPAPWEFYFWEPGTLPNNVEKFSISPDDFAKLIKNQRPSTGTFLGNVNPVFKIMSEKEFIQFLKVHHAKPTFFSKLKSLF